MQANQLNATQFNREHVFQDFEGLWSFSWQREDKQIGSLEVGDYFERRPERCEEWKEIHYKYRNTLQIQKYTTDIEIHYKYRNTPQIQGCWLFGAKAEAGVRSSPVQFWQIIGQASASQLNVAPLPLHE